MLSHLLCLLLTSASLSGSYCYDPLCLTAQTHRSPGVRYCCSRIPCQIYPGLYVWFSGFCIPGCITQRLWPCICFLFVMVTLSLLASFGFRVASDTLAFCSWFLPVRPIGDLNPQLQYHAQRTRVKRARSSLVCFKTSDEPAQLLLLSLCWYRR